LDATNTSDPRKQLWCIPDDVIVQPMVAVVPDPVHTHMALLYDRSVEAIQLAADTKGYVIDRYWLPWSATAQPEWSDYDSRHKALQEEKEKQQQPGLLLFRWKGEETKEMPAILYVFLVSDTSTNGVNGTQFNKALQYAKELCSYGCAKTNPIYILGPTFSGSLASLRQTP